MDVFVLKPTLKLTSPLRRSVLLQHPQMGLKIRRVRCVLMHQLSRLCHYGFPMLIKISVCLPSHLTRC